MGCCPVTPRRPGQVPQLCEECPAALLVLSCSSQSFCCSISPSLKHLLRWSSVCWVRAKEYLAAVGSSNSCFLQLIPTQSISSGLGNWDKLLSLDKSQDKELKAWFYQCHLRCSICNSPSPLLRAIKDQTQQKGCLKAQNFPIKVFLTSPSSAGVEHRSVQ